MKNMRIGVDIRSLMDKEYSGVSWYTLFLLEEILRQDKIDEYFLYYNSGKNIAARLPKFEQGNVKIISTNYPNKIFNYVLQKIFHWPKLNVIASEAKQSRSYSTSVKTISLPRSETTRNEGVDIFWSPHINFSSFSRKCRKILTIHDLSFLIHPEFFSWRKNFWHYFLDAKKMITQADLIVAISENTKQDIVRLTGFSEEKIKVIHGGVGKEFFPIREGEDENLQVVKEKYHLPEKFILYLGTIEPRKNIAGLVKAFDKAADSPELAGYELIIAGGRGWKNEEVFKAINLAKNKDKIKVIGYIENSEKNYFYNLAKIFCYPSFYEGFGLPVVEAMAAGTPVITSSSSSLPEVAGEAALLIDPFDINQLSEAIRQLAGNENLRQEFSKKGLVQAKKFSWERAAKEYLKMINDE
jgi:glycosyltransferase involved in cell wall biosynthesis